MTAESPADVKFEIGHVLFIDIVGYSKLLINEQSEQLEALKRNVRGTEQFRLAEAEGKLLRLPTGDGGALVFRTNPEAPVLCAMEIAKALKEYPDLRVRMGIHSGPVNEISDLNEQANIAGAGINIAQRIMDCGDTGHILLSKHVADDLEQYPQWQSQLHPLGECEVKHGARIGVVNLYRNGIGNPQVPNKFKVLEQRRTRARWTAIAAALLLLSGIIAAFMVLSKKGGSIFNSTNESSIPEKSIAVLPFDNLSSDKENAYFAEGVQDEILTRLSKIAALKVISRTSTQKYKSAPDNLREVGRQLGVANLLEGSVQKAGNAVHINVQLIKAATDAHVWAESYDRELQNIFGVEAEVAGAIADQLNAKLSGNEQRELAARPTKNPDAYDAYLRGLAFEGGVEDFVASLLKSIQAFENAVRLDPEFALAWAHLCRQSGLLFLNIDQSPQRREAARKALDMATKFGPDLVETQLARGFYKYFVERDYEGAKAQLEAVRRQYPNNAVAVEFLGGLARRQGRWEDSRRFYAQAIELDPQNIFLLTDASLTDLDTRDAVAAQKHLGRARDLSPQNSTVIGLLASNFQQTGDVPQAQTLLETVHPKPGDVIYTGIVAGNAIFLRKYDAAIAMLKTQLEEPQALGSSLGSFENLLGDLERHAGHAAEAATAYEKAKEVLNEFLRLQPDNAEFLNQLAWTETWLDDKAGAIAHIQRAIALLPASKDAVFGPSYEDTLARIEAHFGDKESAIAALQHLLSISYGSPVVTPALLRLDPDWDNLRNDPRFQKLASAELKTANK